MIDGVSPSSLNSKPISPVMDTCLEMGTDSLSTMFHEVFVHNAIA